jgi:hypothetical protein
MIRYKELRFLLFRILKSKPKGMLRNLIIYTMKKLEELDYEQRVFLNTFTVFKLIDPNYKNHLSQCSSSKLNSRSGYCSYSNSNSNSISRSSSRSRSSSNSCKCDCKSYSLMRWGEVLQELPANANKNISFRSCSKRFSDGDYIYLLYCSNYIYFKAKEIIYLFFKGEKC